MREWLDGVLPAGPWHAWLVDGAHAGTRVAAALALFLALRWLLLRALQGVLVPLLARAGREGEANMARARTLEGLARSGITYVLLFLLVITVLGDLGLNVAALLAGAGVAGLAFSFGAQRLVRDVLTGFFLLVEDQFRVGEVVTLTGVPGIAQTTGTVQEIGLRITRLQDSSGRLMIVSNGDIGAVINHSRGPLTAAVEVGVSPAVELERVRELAAGLSLPEALFASPPEVQGVTALDGTRMVVRVSAPARPGRAPEAELALRQALGEALGRAGIELR